MRYDALAVFTAVAESGGFTAAAARLDMPKSTVSRHVAALEDEVGARLLYRTTRSVSLTPAGRRLLEQVGPHVAALERVTLQDDAPTCPLRVTTTPDLGAAVLADVVARHAVLHPGVRVELLLTAAVVDLVADGVDLALRVTGGRLPDDPHLTASRAGTIHMGLYAAPRYLARAGTPRTLAEVAEHDLVALGDPTPPFGAARVTADDTRFVHAVVRAGGGIGVLPSFLATDDVASGELVPVVPEWTAWSGTVWLVTPHNPLPAHVAAFRALVVDHLARTRPLG